MALEDLRAKTSQLLDEGMRVGALTAEEHSWRKAHLARAESVDALERLVEDLLDADPSAPSLASSSGSQMTVMAHRRFSVADLGRRSELVTIMGSTEIDLTGWDPSAPLTLELVTVMGDALVVVPPGLQVRVECSPVMGDCRVDPAVQDAGSSIRVTGVVLMGSLRVVAKNASARARR